MSSASDEGREKLRSIRSFLQLLEFLRDELDWPVDAADFEDAFFDYTPKELGLDSANAAKIRQIKRLRPLSAQQPWGVYFIDFEPKRLPVVALRRILSSVVLRKRASANATERAAWAQDDLLFISAFGEDSGRHITFAQFTDAGLSSGLPTLKVLGWDSLDTALHLDRAEDLLRDRLRWPDNEDDRQEWRERWRSAFTVRHRQVVTTAGALAEALAELARSIRDRISTLLAIESQEGPLTALMSAFRSALVHDLTQSDFADMYAQTIAYGLLSARIAHAEAAHSEELAAQIPLTNPFLKELMESFLVAGTQRDGIGLDFDELGVGDVVDLLDATDMEAVLRDFGDRNPEEDPVIHFYEHFLHEYDPARRVQRGVFYTPRPVVAFIVKSIDELLRHEFGLEDGLADITTWRELSERAAGLTVPPGIDADDPVVQILDPATGTGTFLVEVIDTIYRTMVEKWRAAGSSRETIDGLWNEYVARDLLPRLHGYELLMAPYAIAHVKIGLKLHETGYRFGSDERARVFLTNSLDPAVDFTGQLAHVVPALAHEAIAVNDLKQKNPFIVVLGNPPYSKNSANRTSSAEALVRPYKELVKAETNVQPLSDDYVKFLALALRLTRGRPSVVGMITNHSYLSGLIHRGMRQLFVEHLSDIRIVDLHGDTNVGEVVPQGLANQNVFDITQGVAVSIFCRRPASQNSQVNYADVWGTRAEKYAALDQPVDQIGWQGLAPAAPYWFFRPIELVRGDASWVALDELFVVKGMGVKSRRDHFLIARNAGELRTRFQRLLDADDVETLRAELQVTDNPQWSLRSMRELVRTEGVEAGTHAITYRPFDQRAIWYHRRAIERGDSRWPVMKHLAHGELSLLSSRQTMNAEFSSALVVRGLSEMKTAESTRGSYAFPLLLAPDGLELGSTPNYRQELLGSYLRALEPVDFLAYVYAVLHSREYRKKYREVLRREFPRVPVEVPPELGDRLVQLGSSLMSVHLLEHTLVASPENTSMIGSGDCRLERVGYSDETVWFDRKKSHGLQGVGKEVWEFQIGGYQVCEKWLKDRLGRDRARAVGGVLLSAQEIRHYQQVVAALDETARLMTMIDAVLAEHGGWPGAFASRAP